MDLHPLIALNFGRKLLSASAPAQNYCDGASCVVFNVLVTSFAFLVALVIILVVLIKKLRYRRAVRKGSIPASMLVSYFPIQRIERGDVGGFTFPVRQPKTRSEISEEACPVCLADVPNPKKWIIFSVCNHATCNSCFKKLVSHHKLHAACPMCREMLAVGEGDRGGQPKKAGELEVGALPPPPANHGEQPQQQQEEVAVTVIVESDAAEGPQAPPAASNADVR